MAVPSDPWVGAPAPSATPPASPAQPGPTGAWPPVGPPAVGPPMGYAPMPQPGYPMGFPPYGAPGGFYPGAFPLPTNGLAIASMVCGILGGCFCITWVPAIIMGFIALNQIKATGNRQSGRGMAIAGIALGAVWALVTVVYVVIMIAGAASNPS